MARRFRGEGDQKVDAKGRVSIPANFRRVVEACDPDFSAGNLARFILVYGDEHRNYLEAFTIEAMDEVDEKMERHPRASPKRKAMERLYSKQAMEITIDETGRIVLPAKLRDKIGLEGTVYIGASGDTFEMWKPETYAAHIAAEAEMDDDFDPTLDPSHYLDDL